MFGGLFEYPAANARVRSIKGALVQPSEWQTLISADGVALTLNALQGTSYGECFEWSTVSPDALPSLRSVEHALRMSTVRDVCKLLRFLHGTPGEFLIGLLHRYELLNIKKTLRRLSQPERREHHLELENYRLAPYSLVLGVEWDDIDTNQELGRVLETTYYRYAYRKGIQVFAESHDLLMFESLLEKAYLDELWRRARALGPADAEPAARFLGPYYDSMALTAFTRLRFQHEIDAPAILPLLSLDACTRITTALYWRLAAADDVDKCLELLRAEQRWRGLVGDSVPATVRNLQRQILQECRRTFIRSSPLRIGPLIAFYFLKEQEVVDLIALLQMKRFQQPVDEDALLVPLMRAA